MFEIVEHLTKFIRPEAFPELQPEGRVAESTDWLEEVKKATGKNLSVNDMDDLDIDIIERVK